MKKVEVVAALIVKDGNVLATQRGYGDFKGGWEFPGGKIEDGETKEEALKREIKEEMNADIEVGEYLTTVEHDYEKFHLTMHVYICSLISDLEFVYHDNGVLEHENMIWLEEGDMYHIDWLDADTKVVDAYQRYLKNNKRILK